MPYKSAQHEGFTLVELIMVVTIMVLMAGAMIPSFTSYLKSQTLKQAQERVKSDLRSIQNKALTGALYDKTVDVAGTPQSVTHWGVRFTTNSPTYSYFIAYATTGGQFTSECNNFNAGQGNGNSRRLQGTGTLPSDMVFKSASGCLFFDFKNGTTRPVLAGFTSPLYFGYTASSATGNCRNIRFNWAGSIFNTNADQCSCANPATCQ